VAHGGTSPAASNEGHSDTGLEARPGEHRDGVPNLDRGWLLIGGRSPPVAGARSAAERRGVA
jgi:hypothetical protein